MAKLSIQHRNLGASRIRVRSSYVHAEPTASGLIVLPNPWCNPENHAVSTELNRNPVPSEQKADMNLRHPGRVAFRVEGMGLGPADFEKRVLRKLCLADLRQGYSIRVRPESSFDHHGVWGAMP